ncbi:MULTISPECIES: hypothetical protein [Halostagnicola]|uniref:Uncharacterized protein n=1 Tax=Halostagnicola kamekurae TaxID=619731 RepID=A0A1I6RRN0_9EURY|nr:MULTISPECIES: hypothetical protein [Halostagnicola]SFS67270.1 hypothetical protein SAMN04488556_2024 [Halostagnicola kamekurae]
MALDEFLSGDALTGRQAAIIFFTFLGLVILGGILLILFGDVFQNLFT